ncbi:hypothetical protein LCGC14_0737140 [marine sediment metagenome]|uniref:HK97 gp10 family phage protein n=1 Tax=marine sediment metagenome TaxID=412755 RepID=A0A0F9SSN2_9ZZZZ
MVKITIHDDMLTAAIKDRAEKVLTAAASHVKSQARLTVPVDTGDLLNSIDTKQEGLEAKIGSDLHYAAYVEAGTSKMAAQPYLRPALMSSIAVLKRMLRAKL